MIQIKIQNIKNSYDPVKDQDNLRYKYFHHPIVIKKEAEKHAIKIPKNARYWTATVPAPREGGWNFEELRYCNAVPPHPC